MADLYKEIYEFAASAGAFEGYVYPKKDLRVEYLPGWVNNLLKSYRSLPKEVVEEIQSSLDRTLGRAILALTPVLGEDHEIIAKLKQMTSGRLPRSFDDFEEEKKKKELKSNHEGGKGQIT